jgi:hypothetical protein
MKNIVRSVIVVTLCLLFNIFCDHGKSPDDIFNSYLSNLEIGSINLSPTFSPDVFNYDAIFPSYPKSVNVIPTAYDSQATITVNGTIVQSDSSFQVDMPGPTQYVITIFVKSPKSDFTSGYIITIKEE